MSMRPRLAALAAGVAAAALLSVAPGVVAPPAASAAEPSSPRVELRSAASPAPWVELRSAASPCPFATAPGPPVDESEEPEPGQSPPPPLPVPAQPVGGPAMGLCGDVVARGAPAPPDVGVVSYVVADLDSGAVLAARNPHARLRPASLMKTLTGLIAARDLPMDETIVGTQADADQEGTRVGMGPGGRYQVRQVLDAMLMASGNDAAHALAVRHSGSVEAAVAAMNRTAASLGALDTRAATPSGLDGPGMQTSAFDLASIFRVAMREPEFARATGTRSMMLPGFGGSGPVPVSNDNKLLANYEGAIGGKTGFTDDARHTYIGAAQRDGRRLVAVLMRGEQRPVPMYEQAITLLDYGFARSADQRIGELADRRAAAVDDDAGGTSPAGLAGAGPADAPAATSDWGTPVALVIVGAGVLALLVLAVRLRNRT